MTIKTLTTAELKQEREHAEMQLSELMFQIHTDRNPDNITEMHREWNRRRFQEQINNIEQEMESRNV